MTDIENVQPEEIPAETNVDVATQEEMIPKSLVTKIVERERLKAFDKAEKKYMEQLAAQTQLQEQQPEAQPQGQQLGLGGMNQMSQADIERLIAEHAPQALMQHVNQLKQQHTVDTLVNKMQSAEQKYPGLQEKLGDFLEDDPHGYGAKLITMTNDYGNTADVVKELMDNPMKMGSLLGFIQSGNSKTAKKLLSDLSNSINVNQQALEEDKQARDPMSSLKPSTKAGIDNSDMSVTDFRKMFRR